MIGATAAAAVDTTARAFQKKEDGVNVFWDRKISPAFTHAFIRLGVSPNAATLLWGAISVANSYTLYRALVGDFWLIPAVWAVYVLASVIDCADGEVARATSRVNPVAGKLLDGICHRATEYSIVGAFGVAASTLTASPWALPVTVLVLTGDAMQSYVYERRIAILRVEQKAAGHITRKADTLYAWGTPWLALTPRQKLATITGLFHYKSVYPVIALAYVSGIALLIGLAALGVYKHVKWMRLMQRTIAPPRPQGAEGGSAG